VVIQSPISNLEFGSPEWFDSFFDNFNVPYFFDEPPSFDSEIEYDALVTLESSFDATRTSIRNELLLHLRNQQNLLNSLEQLCLGYSNWFSNDNDGIRSFTALLIERLFGPTFSGDITSDGPSDLTPISSLPSTTVRPKRTRFVPDKLKDSFVATRSPTKGNKQTGSNNKFNVHQIIGIHQGYKKEFEITAIWDHDKPKIGKGPYTTPATDTFHMTAMLCTYLLGHHVPLFKRGRKVLPDTDISKIVIDKRPTVQKIFVYFVTYSNPIDAFDVCNLAPGKIIQFFDSEPIRTGDLVNGYSYEIIDSFFNDVDGIWAYREFNPSINNHDGWSNSDDDVSNNIDHSHTDSIHNNDLTAETPPLNESISTTDPIIDNINSRAHTFLSGHFSSTIDSFVPQHPSVETDLHAMSSDLNINTQISMSEVFINPDLEATVEGDSHFEDIFVPFDTLPTSDIEIQHCLLPFLATLYVKSRALQKLKPFAKWHLLQQQQWRKVLIKHLLWLDKEISLWEEKRMIFIYSILFLDTLLYRLTVFYRVPQSKQAMMLLMFI
jgi:hypothetical protein